MEQKKRPRDEGESEQAQPVKKQKISGAVFAGDKTKNAKGKGRVPKINQSAWMVTIVDNHPFEDSDWRYDVYDELLQKMLTEFWGDEEKIWNILFVNKGVTKKEWKTFVFYFVTEKAPKTKKLHAHGVVNWIHSIRISLLYKKLQMELTDEYQKQVINYNEACKRDNREKYIVPIPEGKLYVHYDLIKDDEWKSKLFKTESMKEYIMKNRKWDIELDQTAKGMELLKQMDAMTSAVPDSVVPATTNEDIEEEKIILPKKRKQADIPVEQPKVVKKVAPAKDVENREVVKQRMQAMEDKEREINERIKKIQQLQAAEEKRIMDEQREFRQHMNHMSTMNVKRQGPPQYVPRGEMEDDDSEEDEPVRAPRVPIHRPPVQMNRKAPLQVRSKISVVKLSVPDVSNYRVQLPGSNQKKKQ